MTSLQRSRVSVVVALKDNVERSQHFIEHHAKGHPNVAFIIADGSLTESNQKLFTSQKIAKIRNFEYLRFPPDVALSSYLMKMRRVSEMVRSDYAMTMDPGDFLNYDGVMHAVTLLESNRNASVCGGDILISYALCGRLTNPQVLHSLAFLAGLPLLEALEALRSRYAYIWYGLFRRQSFAEMWSFISRNNFTHPMMEYSTNIAGLASGEMIYSPVPLILRVADRPTIKTLQPPSFNISKSANLMAELGRFGKLCQLEYGVSEQVVVDAFQKNAREVMYQLYRQDRQEESSSNFLRLQTINQLGRLGSLGPTISYAVGLVSAIKRAFFSPGSLRLLASPEKTLENLNAVLLPQKAERSP